MASSAGKSTELIIRLSWARERALVWIDGRFEQICGPGLHLFWQAFHKVRVEEIDARELRFEHRALANILEVQNRGQFLERITVSPVRT